MKTLFKTLVFAALLVIAATSCKKLTETDQATANDATVGEYATSDVLLFSNGETGSSKDALDNVYDTTCRTVTFTYNDDSTITKTITFNDCNIGDGISRTGQIKITFKPGWKFRLNTPATVELINFKRGREQHIFNGKHTIKLTAFEPLTFEINAENMSITFDNGETYKWSGTRTIEWLKGFSTYRYNKDDSIRANFTHDAYNRKGEHLNVVGTDIIHSFCENRIKITSGFVVINNLDKDKKITVEFNGCGSYTINDQQVEQTSE